jgi:hypothetical protein
MYLSDALGHCIRKLELQQGNVVRHESLAVERLPPGAPVLIFKKPSIAKCSFNTPTCMLIICTRADAKSKEHLHAHHLLLNN